MWRREKKSYNVSEQANNKNACLKFMKHGLVTTLISMPVAAACTVLLAEADFILH